MAINQKQMIQEIDTEAMTRKETKTVQSLNIYTDLNGRSSSAPLLSVGALLTSLSE